jgi:hypothetical protein
MAVPSKDASDGFLSPDKFREKLKRKYGPGELATWTTEPSACDELRDELRAKAEVLRHSRGEITKKEKELKAVLEELKVLKANHEQLEREFDGGGDPRCSWYVLPQGKDTRPVHAANWKIGDLTKTTHNEKDVVWSVVMHGKQHAWAAEAHSVCITPTGQSEYEKNGVVPSCEVID